MRTRIIFLCSILTFMVCLIPHQTMAHGDHLQEGEKCSPHKTCDSAKGLICSEEDKVCVCKDAKEGMVMHPEGCRHPIGSECNIKSNDNMEDQKKECPNFAGCEYESKTNSDDPIKTGGGGDGDGEGKTRLGRCVCPQGAECNKPLLVSDDGSTSLKAQASALLILLLAMIL